MKRIFDDAANPSLQADLQARALEKTILMASKGADSDDTVAGGHKIRGVAKSGYSIQADQKKAAQTYLDIITLQDQINHDLKSLTTDLRILGDDLHIINLRMTQRQVEIDFITQNILSEDDMVDASRNYNPRVKALLDKYGKSDLPLDEAYVFIQTTLTQRLIDEQTSDQDIRNNTMAKIEAKQQDIADKVKQGRDAGMNMTDTEQQVATISERLSQSKLKAEQAVSETDAVFTEEYSSTASVDFLIDGSLNL